MDIKSQEANREAAQANLDKAKLSLIYCRIVAPIGGIVTQRSAEIGARVSAGQQLLMVVQTNDLWVTANFKETQLARMRPGQPVRIYVDALKRISRGMSSPCRLLPVREPVYYHTKMPRAITYGVCSS